MSLATVLTVLLVASNNPAGAVSACMNEMANGACSVEWNGASLKLTDRGSNTIEVRSSKGELLKWSFSCTIDRVEDTRTCSLQGGNKGSISIARIFLKGGGITNAVNWGGHKFPGSEKIAKIGKGAPMRWDSDTTIFGAKAVRVIEAAKRGGVGIFRWFDWPAEQAHDEEINFDNFEIVWDLFKAAVESS
jgi:hypothetical protein